MFFNEKNSNLWYNKYIRLRIIFMILYSSLNMTFYVLTDFC